MTYYGAKELAASFRTVRKNTIKIAEEIDEQHYGFRAAPNTRTVGEFLTHIAVTPRLSLQVHAVEKVTKLIDFDFPTFFGKILSEEQEARTKRQILELLQEEGDRYANWLDGVSDDILAEEVVLPQPGTVLVKTRFEMLLGVKEHEMHHRAQLVLIERMLGMVPHLTREMQARMESIQASKTSA
jgi:uncharacterized damage-inducible protein DinB